MRYLYMLFLTCSFLQTHAQSDSSWVLTLIQPDLKIEFPEKAATRIEAGKELHSLSYGTAQFEITSEKSPLNYYGRTIKEVNDEYYGSLTKNVLQAGGKSRQLLSERNFKLDGFDVRELIYLDSIQNKEAKVTHWILNVIGIREACYNIKFIDFQRSENIPDIGLKFFRSIDIYYKIEKGIQEYPQQEAERSTDENLVTDPHKKKKKK